jgi:hypothetical protein
MDSTPTPESRASAESGWPFHGGNASSNLAGDAKQNNNIRSAQTAVAPHSATVRQRNSTPIARTHTAASHPVLRYGMPREQVGSTAIGCSFGG